MARPDLINRFRNLVPYGVQWITREYICGKMGASFSDIDDCFRHFVRKGNLREMQQSISRREEKWHKREIALDPDRNHVRFYIMSRPVDWNSIGQDEYFAAYGKSKSTRVCKICQKPIKRRHSKPDAGHSKDECDLAQTELILKS